MRTLEDFQMISAAKVNWVKKRSCFGGRVGNNSPQTPRWTNMEKRWFKVISVKKIGKGWLRK